MTALQYRAGRYITQPTGYRAFFPAPLPPEPAVHLSGTLQSLLSSADRARSAVTTGLGRAAANGHRVLEHLYQRPIMSVAGVQELTGTTYTAANNIVARLVELGILQEATGYRRNRLFRYQPYIAIFGEDPPQDGRA
jgi:hypothetical protein